MSLLSEDTVQHLANTCSALLLLSQGDDTNNTKFTHLFKIVEDATIRKCREQKRTSHEPIDQISLDESSTDWMDGFFDEIFLNHEATFELDLNMDQYMDHDIV